MVPDGVRIWATHSNGACVLRIAGELDVATADAFSASAAVSVRAVPGPVLVNLSGLAFLDARGARALDALIQNPPDGRVIVVRYCPLRIRRMLDVLRLPLVCPPAEDRTTSPTVTTALADQVQRGRARARESRLDASGTLARLTDTLIRLANTKERGDLIREQGRRTLASSRAARQQLIQSRQGNPAATAARAKATAQGSTRSAP